MENKIDIYSYIVAIVEITIWLGSKIYRKGGGLFAYLMIQLKFNNLFDSKLNCNETLNQ